MPSAAHSWRGAVAAIGAACLLGACGTDPALGDLDTLRDQPLLEPPPGATLLGRAERDAEEGLILGIDTTAAVEMVYASPESLAEVIDHYQREHGDLYGLVRAGGSDEMETRLRGSTSGANAGVTITTGPPRPQLSQSASELDPAPAGMQTFIVVRLAGAPP